MLIIGTATSYIIMWITQFHVNIYLKISIWIRNLQLLFYKYFRSHKRKYSYSKKKSSRQYSKRHISWNKYTRQYVYYNHNISYCKTNTPTINKKYNSSIPSSSTIPSINTTYPTSCQSTCTSTTDNNNLTIIYQHMLSYNASNDIDEDNITQFDSDSVPIRIDNCCSRTLSFCKNDFDLTTFKEIPSDQKVVIKGFGNTLTTITHSGTISWHITDDNGVQQNIRIPNSFYVPSSQVRLLSPQHWAQEVRDHAPNPQGTWCATHHDRVILYWNQGKSIKTIKLDTTKSNTAIMYTVPGTSKYAAFIQELQNASLHTYAYVSELTPQDIDEGPDNYDDDPTYIMKMKPPLNDITDEVIISDDIDATIYEEGDSVTHTYSKLNPSEELLIWHNRMTHMPMKRLQNLAAQGTLPKRLATCPIPLCPACLYGKSTRKAWRTKEPPHTITPPNLKPGDMVSVDQLQSSVTGLLGQIKGIPTRARFTIATVYIDHASDFTFVYPQCTASAEETMKSKLEFERLALTYGISIKRYHSDNGRFSENAWLHDVRRKNQRLTMCGVNAHHQNGKAERRIRQLSDMTRTALLQASTLWPTAINTHLWPYALRKACDDINKVQHHTKMESPIELFSGVHVKPDLQNNHPFGCPVYVLHKDLQAGQKIPKWEARARLGIYLGPSMIHASNVGLVLSLSTGCVSPQYHLKYDDKFITVSKSFNDYIPRSLWQIKCGFKANQLTPLLSISPTQDNSNITTNIISEGASEGGSEGVSEGAPNLVFDNNDTNVTDDYQPYDNTVTYDAAVPIPISTNISDTTNNVVTTRSGRVSRKPDRYGEYEVYESIALTDQDYQHYTAYVASSDPDIMYYHEILKEPDKPQFIQAMEKEVQQHNDRKNWKLVKRTNIPSNFKVLPCVWAMRRKRNLTTGVITKWKARLNVDGSKQVQGVDFTGTYAPVASWASIRLILLISVLKGWKRKQLDFVQAFPQAPVEQELYIDIPRGCKIEKDSNHNPNDKYALQVLNNIYGQRQAGKVWYEYLTKGLVDKLGFQQSVNDPCILWRGNTIMIVYTDDTIITGPNIKDIDKMIQDISTIYEITHDDKVTDFLGVNIKTDEKTGNISLTQQQLILSILKDLGLNQNPKLRMTPALSTKILQSYKTSPIHNEAWSYRAVIGKLNYLEKSTRPDIAYAVHQCARFSADPRIDHTKAVKDIGRYLANTKDKGIIFKPDNEGMLCYSDADFAGNWCKEYAATDSTTARSRTGFVVKYSGCPLIWGSRLQTEVALSSTESEYIALSQSLREVIPLIELIEELHQNGFQFNNDTPKVICKAFEDNNGALEMAKTHKIRPRTKHINVKYHHFREAVNDGKITLLRVDTTEQQADIFTKPLDDNTFIYLRKLIIGW